MSDASPPMLPPLVRARMIARMFTVQATWNYDTLIGTGLGYCLEPALRLLPGGPDGQAYREALVRESQYFNAHPYLASVAVGALARAELEAVPPQRIERFREIMCAPLGSIGDRLFWTGWLPLSVFVAFAAFGVGAAPISAVWLFLVMYNVAHLVIRAWGFHVGWTRGLTIAAAFAQPAIRVAPEWVTRAVAVLAGFALPLVLMRVLGSGRGYLNVVILAIAAGTILITRLRPYIGSGWIVASVLLGAFTLFAALDQ